MVAVARSGGSKQRVNRSPSRYAVMPLAVTLHTPGKTNSASPAPLKASRA